jgi:hypothetical protein
LLAVKPTTLVDGRAVAAFPLEPDGLATAEIDVGRDPMVDALVIPAVGVTLDGGLDLGVEVARQIIIFEPDGVLKRGVLALVRRIDALFMAWPFLGSRRMTAMLRADGLTVNRKRVQPLMRLMGIAALGPKPRTSKPAPGHTIFPYLLRDLAIDRPLEPPAPPT